MNYTPNINELKTDIRIANVLIADMLAHSLPYDEQSVKPALATILGTSKFHYTTGIAEEFYRTFKDDPASFNEMDISEYGIWDAVEHCVDFLNQQCPVQSADLREAYDLGYEPLYKFVDFIPRTETEAGQCAWPYYIHGPESHVLHMLDMTRAKLLVVEAIRDVGFDQGNYIAPITPYDLSLVTGMNMQSIRNATGPKGNKPIKTIRTAVNNKFGEDKMLNCNDLDAFEWLAGRRKFDIGGIQPEWANEQISQITRTGTIAALPGVFAWMNKVTTEQVADVLGWAPEKFSAWTRNKGVDLRAAEKVANAVGLNAELYAEQLRKLRKGA